MQDYGKTKMRYSDYTMTPSGLQYKDVKVLNLYHYKYGLSRSSLPAVIDKFIEAIVNGLG
jgi:hypothetical protein